MVFGNPEHLFFYCLVVSLSNGRGSKGEGQIEKNEEPSLEIVSFRQRLKDNFTLSLGERKVGRRCYADNQTISWIAS